jgi:hypothetical protein
MNQPQQSALVKLAPEQLVHRVLEGEVLDIVEPSQFNAFYAGMKQHAHVLSPVTHIGSLPALWKIVPTLVHINPDPAAKEVYRDPLFCDDHEFALTKVGLRRIAQAAALNTECVRLDSGTVQHVFEFLGRIKFRGFDAQWHSYEAPVLWDLRDGSPFVKRLLNAAEKNEKRQRAKVSPEDWIKKQLDAARYHAYRNGASRAVNAAIREFGLNQKSTRDELRKPFACFTMVVNPNRQDLEQERMVLAAALGASNLLGYPSPTPALPGAFDPLAENDPPEPRSHRIASGDVVDGDRSFGDAPAEPARDWKEYPVEDAGARNGGGFYVQVPNLRLFTDDESAARAAHGQKVAKRPIFVETEKRQDGTTWILELRTETPTAGEDRY